MNAIGRTARVTGAVLCACVLVPSGVRAQSGGPGWSLSARVLVAGVGDELGPFVDGAGVGGALGIERELSSRWRVGARGAVRRFGGSAGPDWTVWSVVGEVDFELLAPTAPIDVRVGLGGGPVWLAQGDPGASPGAVDLGTISVPGLVGGLRLGVPLTAAMALALEPRALRTIPTGDDVAGPDSSWVWEIGAGIDIRL